MNWSSEHDATLRRLWANGLSASTIASEMRLVSRSAVIGRIHRLKLPSPISKRANSANNRKPRAPSAPRPHLAPPPAARLRNGHDPSQRRNPSHNIVAAISIAGTERGLPEKLKGEAPDGTGIKLIDLDASTCHWPKGDPADPAFEFCGGYALKGLPYCQHHSRIAYLPSSRAMRGV